MGKSNFELLLECRECRELVKVLGRHRAHREIKKASKTMKPYHYYCMPTIMGRLSWKDTPQGEQFWSAVYGLGDSNMNRKTLIGRINEHCNTRKHSTK